MAVAEKAARTEWCRQPPAPDPGRARSSSHRAAATVDAWPAPSHPDASLLALLAHPAIASVSDTGMPHVLVPAGLVRNLVDVLLMFVGDYDSDPTTWPGADVSKLAAAHAVLARTTPIADAPAG